MTDSKTVILDRINAGLLDMDDFRRQVIDEVYAGLHRFCQIPDAYQHCELATRQMDLDRLDESGLRDMMRNPPPEIVNPHPAHLKAISLFDLLLSGDTMACSGGDPLSPTLGAYLYGPPGCGKTHLMSAYGRRVKAMLDERLAHVHALMSEAIEKAYDTYTLRRASEENTTEPVGQLTLAGTKIEKQASPEEEFWQTIDEFKRRLSQHPYQPTDLIYIGFKELFEVCKHSPQRHAALAALESARIVFIDDIHPQGDPEQVQLVLHLLERRYELGRSGTFLTTNLPTIELGGGDEMLGSRLMSRCAETLVTIDFTGCDDWRQTVKSRRIKLVEKELERRMANHVPRSDETD